MNEEEDLNPLQFVSNVIELKPDKKYLMVFKGLNQHQLNAINDALRARGFDCLCITAFEGQEVKVIEAPTKQKKEYPIDPFGGAPFSEGEGLKH